MTREEAAELWRQGFKHRIGLKEDIARSESRYTRAAHEFMIKKPYYATEEGKQCRQ